LKPLHYIASLPCEILILPYIHNLQPLNNILQSDAKAPVWLREQLQELITFLKSKKIVHRDVGGHNICIGNINDAPTQLFLNDLAYMTYLDDEGMPLPLSMEEHVKKVLPNWQNEDKIFSHLLRRIDQKIVADLESSSVLSRQ
ncbi:MAG: hypothetical protein IJZ18_01585, partial [Mailhella sp.]|nr:hypothetical protein [Mailhella sp.]